MGSVRSLAMPLLLFIGQNFVVAAPPLSLVVTGNGVPGAGHLDPQLQDTDFLRKLNDTIDGNALSSPAVTGTTPGLTLPSNDNALECESLTATEYKCTDVPNGAVVYVERPNPYVTIPSFGKLMSEVENDLEYWVHEYGPQAPFSREEVWKDDEGDFGFIARQLRTTTIEQPLRMRHILSVARVIQAEKARVGGEVVVKFVVYNISGKGKPEAKVGTGGLERL